MKYDPLNDGNSCVEYIDHLGDDLRVVNAARVSFGKQCNFEFDETGKWLLDQDAQLIAYLAEHEHISPFFHPQICLRIAMPVFLARQWWRSTVGVSRSEVYRRYVWSEPKLFGPKHWRLRPNDPGQDSDSDEEMLDADLAAKFANRVDEFYEKASELYREAIDLGITTEMANMLLPQSMYTSWIETGSLHYFARIRSLHACKSAQGEICLYTDAIRDIASRLFPVSWAALMS